MVNNQILVSIVNVLMTLEILLSVSKCLSYLLNQVHLFHTLHHNWFRIFAILEFLFNSFDDYNACVVFHQLQEDDL